MRAPANDAAFGRRAMLLGGLAAGAGALVSACASAESLTPVESRAATPARPRVRFGLNYTPSKHWWFIWQNWDPKRIDNDLAQIASLGMDHIRAQLMWDIFQPAANQVNPLFMDRLSQLLDLAGKHSLDVDVSVLTGYLSGQQFLPKWARAGNWVNRPDLVAGEVLFFQKLGEQVGRHPRLMGFDLGNELLGRAPCTDITQLSVWAATLLTAAREGSPTGLHTVSATGQFLPPYPTISAVMGDVSVIHPWYFATNAIANGQLNSEPLHHVEFNIEYIKAFHTFAPHEPARQVWVQEVGAPSVNFKNTPAIPVAFQPEFATATYENALSCPDLYGITWWDSHDIDLTSVPNVFHVPEPTLGVFDVNGREKPIGAAISDVIVRWKNGSIPAPAARATAVVGNDNINFSALLAQNVRPSIVQSALAADRNYLARRGITRVMA